MKIAVIVLVLGMAIMITLALRRAKRKQIAEAAYDNLKALPAISKDFTTPEGAILCLEDAYRHRNIEAAVACKDFVTEARLMLHQLGGGIELDESALKETAETLELGYRQEMTHSWPDFSSLESFFTDRKQHSDGVVVVTEMCRFPDGLFSQEKILVAQTQNGWRVLNPVSE